LPLDDFRSCKTKPSAHGSYLAPYRYSFIPKSTSIVPQPSTVRKRPSPNFLHKYFRRKHLESRQPVCLQSVLVSGDSEERLAARGPLARSPSTTSPPLQLGRFRGLRQRPLIPALATQRAFDYEYGAAAMTSMAPKTPDAAQSQK